MAERHPVLRHGCLDYSTVRTELLRKLQECILIVPYRCDADIGVGVEPMLEVRQSTDVASDRCDGDVLVCADGFGCGLQECWDLSVPARISICQETSMRY
eukprot:COSAG05_NODE_898_length_6685_cov_4.419223_10_plen_100_part_00